MTPPVNYDEARFWLAFGLGVINLLGTAGVAVYAWIVAQSKNSTQHIKALEQVFLEKMGEYGSRMDKVETQMGFLPTPQQISAMQGELREIAATQRAQHTANDQRLNAMTATMQRVEDHLLGKR